MAPLKPRPPRQPNPEDVLPYDLTAQRPVEIGRLRGLEGIYERLVRALSHTFTLKLGHRAEVAVISTDGLRFEDLVAGLAWPAGVALLQLEAGDARSAGALIFEPTLVLKLIELRLGAPDLLKAPAGKEKPKPPREDGFTRIELSLIEDLSKALVTDLTGCWKDLLPFRPRVTRMESLSKLIRELAPETPVVATTFDLRLESCRGAFCLALPFSRLKAFESKLR